MLITKQQLKKILYENYLQVLIESISKQNLIAKYNKLDVYEGYLNNLHPKYYKQLGNYFDIYNKENDDFSYGVIIFLLLMHQKYAKTKYIPPEFKDFNRVDFETMQKVITDFAAQFLTKNELLYKELVELDKKVNKIIKKEAEEEANKNSNEFTTRQQLLNKEVRPGLFLLKVINGWQILLPMSVEGSQNIGVQSWCTVYDDGWLQYNKNRIKLYYLAKDGKNYDEQGYGADAPKKPYDYLCLGFNADGSLNLDSGAYGTSVWGNQRGVIKDKQIDMSDAGTKRYAEQDSLYSRLGKATTDSIVSFLKAHYKATGGTTTAKNPDDKTDEEDTFNRITKEKESLARATNYFAEKMDSMPSADNAYTMFLIPTLEHPSLTNEVAEYILRNYILKIDSKMVKSSFYKNSKSDDDYRSVLVLKLLHAHVLLSPESAAICLKILININLLDAQIESGQAKNWGMWSNKDLSKNICQYLESRIEPDLFTSIELANKNANNKFQYQLINLIRKLLANNTSNMFNAYEEAYNLGKYDQFLNFWSTELDRKFNKWKTAGGEIFNLFDDLYKSGKLSEATTTEIALEKIKGYENANYSDIKGNAIIFSPVADPRYLNDEFHREKIEKRIGFKVTKKHISDARNAEKSLKLLNDLFNDHKHRPDKEFLEKSDTIRKIIKKHFYYLANVGQDLYLKNMTISQSSTFPKTMYKVASQILPEGEYFKFLSTYKGYDLSYLAIWIYKAADESEDVNKIITAYDFLNTKMSEMVANDEKDIYGRPAKDSIDQWIHRPIWGGSVGDITEFQRKLTLTLLFKHQTVFESMMKHLIVARSYNSSDNRQNAGKCIGRILQMAIDDSTITFDQGVKFRNRINELAKEWAGDSAGYWINQGWIGYLRDRDN